MSVSLKLTEAGLALKVSPNYQREALVNTSSDLKLRLCPSCYQETRREDLIGVGLKAVIGEKIQLFPICILSSSTSFY